MMTASCIQDVIVKHFDAHQQQVGEDENESGSKTRVRDASVEARVALMTKDLAPLLKQQTNNDSLDEEDLDSPIHTITATVLHCVDAAMAADVSKESQASIDNILELAACFAALPEHAHHLASALVARAVQFSAVIMERVRVQACKLLGMCVEYLRGSNSAQDQDETTTECVDAARKAIVSRLTDKSQAVRNAAICACSSFFSGESEMNENDAALLESFLWNMAHDPSAANRISALQNVGIMDEETVDAIIARVRDVKVKVRVEALNILRSKVSIHSLTSEQFAEIGQSGLTDRCTATCEAATRMICAGWLKAVRYDPIALLGLLEPVVHETECIKVARVVLNVVSEAEGTTIPEALDELSDPEIRALKEGVSNTTALLRTNADSYLEPRAVLFARVKCDQTNASEALSEAQKEKVISKIVPDIPVLCEALELHISRLVEAIQECSDESDDDQDALQDEDILVCSQLLQMAQVADLKEEGSRRHFISAMKKLLEAIETPDDLLEGCIKALKFAHEKESAFLQTISDLISELSTLQGDDSPSIMEEVIQLRIISILAIVLENTGARMASDSTVVGFSSHIVPAVTSRHALVREGGVSCLGRLAILSDSKTVMEEFKPLLLSVASNKDEKLEIRAQAMMAICDLSFLFSDMLSTDDESSSANVAFIPLLSDLLCTSKPAVVGVAAEIASKLLFAGRTLDTHLIANLIVTYFDQGIASLVEDGEDDATEIGSPVRMQQLLSLFFPAFGMRSPECRAALVSSVVPMLTAVNAKLQKKGAKVTDWSMSRMVEYVESLVDCENDNGKKESSSSGDSNDEGTGTTNTSQDNEEPTVSVPTQEPSYSALIAIEVSQFLLNDQSSLKTTVLRQLCKTLGSTHIDVDAADPSILITLKKNMDELEMDVSDATCLRSLKPMAEMLDSLDLDEDNSGGQEDDDGESTETEPDSDAESLAEALEAIAVAERAEKENAVKQDVSVDDDEPRKVSASTPSTSRRRLASLNE